MDLAFKTVESATAGAKLQLVHPFTKLPMEEDGKPVCLLLAGTDSTQWQRCRRQLTKARIDAAAKSRTFEPTSVEQQEAEELTLLLSITLGWEHCAYGGESTFSKELVRQLYEQEPWVREQVNAFITDRSNFSTASKPT